MTPKPEALPWFSERNETFLNVRSRGAQTDTGQIMATPFPYHNNVAHPPNFADFNGRYKSGRDVSQIFYPEFYKLQGVYLLCELVQRIKSFAFWAIASVGGLCALLMQFNKKSVFVDAQRSGILHGPSCLETLCLIYLVQDFS